MEGLRWSWHSWPATKPEVASLVIPLSIMCTPLMPFIELPILPYDPLSCSQCLAVLNPYSRVDYTAKIWDVRFAMGRTGSLNPLGLSSGLSSAPSMNGALGLRSNSSSFTSMSAYFGSSSGSDWAGAGLVVGPAIVFVVDACTPEDELGLLKSELLHVITRLPENALVGLVVFDSMVRVYDLGFAECLRVELFHGEREVSTEQTKQHMIQSHGKSSTVQRKDFLLPVSKCEFNITSAIEDIRSSPQVMQGHRPLRSTGVAISVAVGLLEGCSVNTGSRVMVFTSGPATIGPGIIVNSDLGNAIRTHRDLSNGYAAYYRKSSEFYEQISLRLSDSSIILDLFACSLDQVGAAELKVPVESSGGFMMLGESFGSEQFRKCLRQMFDRDDFGNLKICFDATIEIVTTKDVKICGAVGPCTSMRKMNNSVSNKEIGEGGTYIWKLGTVASKTCIAFFFEMGDEQNGDNVSRRWAGKHSPEIAAGCDQEVAASVMARLAIHRTERNYAHDVVRWLEKMLIRFASKFGDYMPEDPSSFRLSSNFSLYPQFLYYLRRSQFIDVFNSTPDETAYFRMMLNREGVVNSLIMVQPTLFQYSFDGPPIPVLLDVCSISPDVILLFDSFFYVVIHYGSKIAQWRKLGYDKDPNHENFRKLLEAPELDAEHLVAERVPVPKLIKCDQHSSQTRFLLAKLNPSVTQNSTYTEGSEIIFTDDVNLQVFIEHLQELAVQVASFLGFELPAGVIGIHNTDFGVGRVKELTEYMIIWSGQGEEEAKFVGEGGKLAGERSRGHRKNS
ncbi:unnamed protein product [Fraxinus pennsylvanica]|uniref:Protein transport protein SEC23 n=1 Tax=Fraxinus pennsylvanica TaxID=56036 RepID=A0AAD1Z3T7_9LAMI|nr:unnamed protein product [Fraxinus pennsylvanica]